MVRTRKKVIIYYIIGIWVSCFGKQKPIKENKNQVLPNKNQVKAKKINEKNKKISLFIE